MSLAKFIVFLGKIDLTDYSRITKNIAKLNRTYVKENYNILSVYRCLKLPVRIYLAVKCGGNSSKSFSRSSKYIFSKPRLTATMESFFLCS